MHEWDRCPRARFYRDENVLFNICYFYWTCALDFIVKFLTWKLKHARKEFYFEGQIIVIIIDSYGVFIMCQAHSNTILKNIIYSVLKTALQRQDLWKLRDKLKEYIVGRKNSSQLFEEPEIAACIVNYDSILLSCSKMCTTSSPVANYCTEF